VHVVGFVAVSLAIALLGAVAGPTTSHAVSTEPRERVEHHLRAVDELGLHFEGLLRNGCPRFASREEWSTYFDGEVDRVVLLMAHLEQAWLEAKKTPDDEVRRAAKAPRKRVDEARALVDKLQQCAGEHGARFAPLSVWQRIERDVPGKQAEIALPE
jgi:hypothetical protein